MDEGLTRLLRAPACRVGTRIISRVSYVAFSSNHAIRFRRPALGSFKIQEKCFIQSLFTLNIFIRHFRKEFGFNVQFNKVSVLQMVDIKIRLIVDIISLRPL